MGASKLSISLSQELDMALSSMARARGEERSRLIETLLRENTLIRREIESLRTAPTPLKKGRDLNELLLLARVARRSWHRKLASGKVKINALRR